MFKLDKKFIFVCDALETHVKHFYYLQLIKNKFII